VPRIRLTKNFPTKEQNRLDTTLDVLEQNPWPPGYKRLKGLKEELFRVRVGEYRVVYRVEEWRLVVAVIRIAMRSEVYRNL
jgi:mRNA interferase RelE/StbE